MPRTEGFPRTVKALSARRAGGSGLTVEKAAVHYQGGAQPGVVLEPCGHPEPHSQLTAARVFDRAGAVRLAMTVLDAAGYRVALTPDPELGHALGEHACVCTSDEFELAKRAIRTARAIKSEDERLARPRPEGF